MSLKISLARRTLDNVTSVMVAFNGFKTQLDQKQKKGPMKIIDTDKFYQDLPNLDLVLEDIDEDNLESKLTEEEKEGKLQTIEETADDALPSGNTTPQN